MLQLALVYRVVALAMAIWWVAKYIPERERITGCHALLGLLTFAFAGWRRTNESLVCQCRIHRLRADTLLVRAGLRISQRSIFPTLLAYCIP